MALVICGAGGLGREAACVAEMTGVAVRGFLEDFTEAKGIWSWAIRFSEASRSM